MLGLLYLAGLASALLLSFLSSGMETALYRMSRVRIRLLADEGSRLAAMLIAVHDRMDAMVTTILINNNIAAYAATYFTTAQLSAWRLPHTEFISTAVVTPLFFVLTESLPKQLAYSRADIFALSLIRSYSVMQRGMAPVVRILNAISAAMRRLLGASGEANLAQSQRVLLLENLNAGVAEKVLTVEQSRMAGRIMELESVRADAIMIPLDSIPLLYHADVRKNAVALMRERGWNVALLKDGNGRPTGGVVSMNTLALNPGEPEQPVNEVSDHLERVRASMPIPELLNLFRSRHIRLALVMDQGRPAGLITARGIVDRIAGARDGGQRRA